MSVNLADLIPSLKREVTAPGQAPYVLSDDEWKGQLTDAFWEARLTGILGGYTEADGLITPIKAGAPDMPRDLQQMVVLFAGFRMALNTFQNVNSSYKAKAGPVEYEVQKSATTLKALVDALKARLDFLIKNISSFEKNATSVAVFDAVIEKSYAGIGYSSNFVGG